MRKPVENEKIRQWIDEHTAVTNQRDAIVMERQFLRSKRSFVRARRWKTRAYNKLIAIRASLQAKLARV